MRSVEDQPVSTISVAKAILTGQLIVNVPVIIILLGGFFTGRALFPGYIWGILLILFVAAWIWWAFSVPRWRKWAIQNGAPADKLHQWAVLTGLEWSKGSIGSSMSNTEIRVKE